MTVRASLFFIVSMNLNILDDVQLEQLRAIIQESKNIVVCCHKSPDGDAMGATLAWTEYLRMLDKQVTMAVPDAFPDFLRWLPGVERIVRYDKHPDKVETAFQQADTVFCLDFNDTHRVVDMQQTLEQAQARKVLIDHHLQPTVPAELTLSFPEMSSTCELLFRILYQMGEYERMNKHILVALYCGMMTDTGGFTYNSRRPELYYIIGLMLEKRIDKDKIYRQVYNNYSDWCIRFRGFVMYQKLNVISDAHAAFFSITREDMKRFHFVKGDAEGLVNEPLRIKGMQLSISLREDSEIDNKVWVSLRSVEPACCNNLAKLFYNGGGHANASGGQLSCSIEEAERITRQAIKYFSENGG